jgi:ribosomal protein S18 acetylase RimI-like enzyme
MRLDTSRRQNEAIRLYESQGFRRVAPYYPLSEDLKNWLVFFELQLQ